MLRSLKVEYREKPLGLDVNPRFSWIIENDKENLSQKAYHIQVLKSDEVIWDTGVVESNESVLIPYEGTALVAMTEYNVKVNVWDNYDRKFTDETTFETGLISEDNWKAKWITHELPAEETSCPVFTKNISVKKKIKKARIYAACCGVYEIAINGHKAGDAFMAPGWTSYHNRIQYQTYDVTELVSEDTKVAVTVGNGWYKGYLSFTNEPNHYGDRTALLAMMRLEYEDGSVEFVGTNTDWTVETGIIRSAEIYYGEIQDLTVKSTVISNAVLFNSEKIGKIVSQESEEVKITKRFAAIEKITTPKGELVIDFGQNMAGIVEVKLPKFNGDKLTIRHAETLDKEGNFYTENLRAAKSTDIYVYSDDNVDTIVKPHFTFHGFRYICIEGVDESVDISRFTACALHTDMKKSGAFHCDNKMINQLQSNIEWGQRSNFLDIPTDCPQRDERLGWTGDAQVFCSTAAYNFDTALFFKKWLHDVAAETTEEFGVPHVVPNILGEQAGAAVWSDCATIIPWEMYEAYGDKQILVEQYDSMKCWVEYIRKNCNDNGLWQSGFQYGDWLGLDMEIGGDRSGATDRYLVANVYYAYSTRILRDTAKVLGKKNDLSEYAHLYDSLVDKINEEYVTSTGRLVSETQTACVILLHFNLVKPEYKERVLSILEANLSAHKNHLTTGFVGTPYLCKCLTDNGRHDLAEAVFLKEDFPGWFYSVKKGATTIWERWDSILPNGDFDQSGMNSLNHYAYGSIGDWLYKKVAGINALEPGYKKILIKPILTHGMTEVKADYESVYGKIESAWTCKNKKITVDVTIPANTTAVIILPEKEEKVEVGSGSYHFEYETETELEIQRFSFDSTLGELAAEPKARELFDKYAPGMFDNPMIQYAFKMTITELIAMAAESKPLYEMIIAELNK